MPNFARKATLAFKGLFIAGLLRQLQLRRCHVPRGTALRFLFSIRIGAAVAPAGTSGPTGAVSKIVLAVPATRRHLEMSSPVRLGLEVRGDRSGQHRRRPEVLSCRLLAPPTDRSRTTCWQHGAHATPSMLMSRRLRCTPQRYPEIDPSVFTTRWQGTATASTLAAQAAPTSWAAAVMGSALASAP